MYVFVKIASASNSFTNVTAKQAGTSQFFLLLYLLITINYMVYSWNGQYSRS